MDARNSRSTSSRIGAGTPARLEELAQAAVGAERFRSVGSPGYYGAAAVVEREMAAAGWSVDSDTYDDVTFVDEGG